MSSGGGALVQLISSGGSGSDQTSPKRLCPPHAHEFMNNPCLKEQYEQCMKNKDKNKTQEASATCMWTAYTACTKKQIESVALGGHSSM